MMTREEAMRIIEEEELRHYNLFEEHGPRKWDLGIKKRGSQWVVYKVDERWAIWPETEQYFDTENEAWDCFIDRLRASKELEELTQGKYY